MSAESGSWKGYIVHAWKRRGRIRLAGRLEDGSSFAAVVDNPTRRSFVPDPRGDWRTFDGHPLSEVQEAGRTGFGTGLSAVDEFLLFRGIRSAVHLRGVWSAGRRVDRVFANPEIEPSDHRPGIVWSALDIETDRDQRIVSISLVCESREAVFFLPGDGLPARTPPLPGWIRVCATEEELLTAFADTVREWDPDVITGWNVRRFDFTVLARRCEDLHIAFDLGRAEDERVGVKKTASGLTGVTIPGRQVVDAMRVVRGSGRSFSDYRLDTVARAVLGDGKTVKTVGEDKLDDLERLRRDDPEAFCRYNLDDSRLVLRILDATGLDTLTLIRSTLTGLPLNLAWTSIPAFEHIYALELIRRKVLPPRSGSTEEVSGAAGGTVLDATPGLFHNVVVFDFRSLYPSIMRTFNIDPLGFAVTEQVTARSDDLSPESPAGHPQEITAPNGARFSREPGILPALLDTYFDAREKALAAGDEVAAFVYKILMNSFYGVLGSSGCVYGRKELAGAITGFGRYCLLFARDFFNRKGMTVLYGDTDSVFVYAGGDDLSPRGDELAEELNADLAEAIWAGYGVRSRIAIRCDVAYRRFLLPRLRAVTADSSIRGRAKGYAGLIADEDRVDIKGMEAVRSDYTPLAQRFQRELLELLFHDGSAERVDIFVRHRVSELLRGRLDEELTYRKVLRRRAEDYRSSVPPQVRAARKLGWTSRRGPIEYVMTTTGPEPIGRTTSGLDYRHYIDHQLRPIWDSIAEAVDLGDRLAGAEGSRKVPGRDAAARGLQDLAPLDDQLELGL